MSVCGLGCKVKGEVNVEVEDRVGVDVNYNVTQETDGVRGKPTCLEDQRQTFFADANANDSVNDNVNQGNCLED